MHNTYDFELNINMVYLLYSINLISSINEDVILLIELWLINKLMVIL
jgi:hypothetical protein